MFANLKNKLIEEVKASPSKFQQLANAAQAVVSSSTSTTSSGLDSATTTTTNENYFSITEEDTPQNSPQKPRLSGAASHSGRSSTPTQHLNNSVNTGTIPRTRRLSNSSMASDISFRLPAQDSVHHLQSDLDISASEIEDTNSSVKLETITKEQLYNAYKTSLDRYNKYRCRYTDLAKKYKDLERDSAKARSVLVETQEKAIRRISELREQCALEQHAKAHLEEALRMEMDDMQCKMQAYQTKLQLLGENPEQIAAVLSSGTASGTNANKETALIELDVNEHDDWRGTEKRDTIEESLSKHYSNENHDDTDLKLQQQLKEYEIKLKNVNKKYEESLATIELLRKEKEDEKAHQSNELKLLQNTVKTLQTDLQKAAKETSGEDSIKYEMEEKISTNNRLFTELKEKYVLQTEALAAARENLNELEQKSTIKVEDLQQQNVQLREANERYKRNEVSLAEIDNELNQTRNENDILKSSLLQIEQKLKEVEGKVKAQRDSTDEEREMLRLSYEERIREFEDKIQNYTELLEESRKEREYGHQKIQQLQAEMEVANKAKMEMESDLKSTQSQLAQAEEELIKRANLLESSQKEDEIKKTMIEKQMDQIDKLQEELQTTRINAQEQKEQDEREKSSLKEQFTSIFNEITDMEQQMHIVQQSHAVLEQEKRALEDKIEKIQQNSYVESHWYEQLQASEIKLAKLEEKLQNVESENAQLAEKNCLLVENSTRLEKLIADRERQQNEALENVVINGMEAKLETAEATIQKLNNKLTQVLDENSRMQNAQELMDHDYRTLQDKFSALEKENLIALDNKQCLELKLQQLKNAAELAQETEFEKQFENEQRFTTELRNELTILKERRLQMESENSLIKKELHELQETLSQKERQYNAILEDKEQAIEALQKEIGVVNKKLFGTDESLKEANEELVRLRLDNHTLNINMIQIKDELETKERELYSTQKDFEIIQHELLKITKNLELKEVEIKSMQESQKEDYHKFKEELHEKQKRIDDIESEIKHHKNHDKEINSLKEKLQKVIDERDRKNEELLLVREQNSRLNEDLNITSENLRQKLEVIKMLKMEQEEQKNNRNDELFELKEKIAELNEELIRSKEEIIVLKRSEQELRANLKKADDFERAKIQQIQELEKALDKEKENSQRVTNPGNSEQLQIENEYLNKHVNQLETDLVKQKQTAEKAITEMQETGVKLKSLQCELYVLQESHEKHNKELDQKREELEMSRLELAELKQQFEFEQIDKQRQTDHIKFITDQNDNIQKQLLESQQKVNALERKQGQIVQLLESTKQELVELKETKEQEVQRLMDQVAANVKAKEQSSLELNNPESELAERPIALTTHTSVRSENNTNDSTKSSHTDSEHLRELNKILQNELEDLKHKSNSEILNLQQETEDLQSTIKQLRERINEYDELGSSGTINQSQKQQRQEENNDGEDSNEIKLRNIMQEVQDVSNRNLFLEQKCENYLILEQSNERLKLQNAKLTRQLDETLVSMHYSESIAANTEFEYLKNIMFQYLTGATTANNETLVKVISAVLKFSPQQTQVALEKEHQRRSLLSKIL